jgi:L-ornithine Nalpha-acyltransferase
MASTLADAPDETAPAVLPARRIGPAIGRLGALEVRLAEGEAELRLAQRLRFRVFYEDRGAAAPGKALDADPFDPVCDHLLVIDHAAPAGPEVVGTYRLLRQEVAARHFGFYSAAEFDIEPMLAAKGGLRFLELGRSCVLRPYRNKRTVELLWHGIWSYVLHHGIDVMFGCASLDGTDPRRLALPLGFLHHHARAREPWRVRVRPDRALATDLLPRDGLDARAAIAALPPLVKGYWRLGATFGEGAAVDADLDTTDVLVILPVAALNPRYVAYFGPGADRHA